MQDGPQEKPPESPPVVPIGYERVFEPAPEDELLYSLSADGKRKFMHPLVHRGRYWKTRRAIAYALFLLFFALPHLTVAGRPAVQIDLVTRNTYVFGATFNPTDSLILVSFGFGVIVTIFFIASSYGRWWCGYACPQTVYLEFLFRPIEEWLEGGPRRQRALNDAPVNLRKATIKVSKWAIWSVVALAMSITFVAYFTGFWPLVTGLSTEPLAWKGALFTVVGLTGATLFDFGWFRDQMCTIACPYGRLQNVIADQDTILVAYDEPRGEPRMRIRDRVAGVVAGDCIACRACVNACPTGTDIKRGLQPECIGTAQCIDACDEVMKGLGKPIGLIRYTSEREQRGGTRQFWRPRLFVYLALMTVAWSSFAWLVATRGDALVEFVRGGREAYRLLPTGEVANQQRVRITNQRNDTQRFTIEVVSPAEARLVVSESPIVIEPSKLVSVNAVTTVPRDIFVDGRTTVRYLVRSDLGFEREIEFLLLGPYGAAGEQR